MSINDITIGSETKSVTPEQFDELVKQIREDKRMIFMCRIHASNKAHVDHNQFYNRLSVDVPDTTFWQRLRWLFTGRFSERPPDTD
jgi:hypothetical protein